MGDSGPVHAPSETVVSDGIEFKVNSREYRYTPLTVSGRQVAPAGVFVIIDLSLKNTYSTPDAVAVPAEVYPCR